MENRTAYWRQKKSILAILGFYTLLTMFFVPRLIFAKDNEQFYADLWMLVTFAVGNYIWAAFTLAVFHLGEYYPIIAPVKKGNLIRHFVFSLLCAAIFTPVYVVTVDSIHSGTLTANNVSIYFICNTVLNSFTYYTGSLAVHQAVFYSQKYRDRAFRLQQAELEMLKMQLHPHFFFNTLNAISALMYRSPKEADRMIIQLGDLFRVALKKDKTHEVSLKEELEFLQAFLQIHKTLMGKRLQTEWEIAPETLDAQVPNLILQPLAENAIQHGLAPLEAGGQITISAAKQNGNLLLQVSDDGIGFDPAIKRLGGDGIGLSNTRARLENLYGEKQKFSIEESPAGGISVKIEIPFREQTRD